MAKSSESFMPSGNGQVTYEALNLFRVSLTEPLAVRKAWAIWFCDKAASWDSLSHSRILSILSLFCNKFPWVEQERICKREAGL